MVYRSPFYPIAIQGAFMNKSELIDAIATKANASKAAMAVVLNATLEAIAAKKVARFKVGAALSAAVNPVKAKKK
jgi:nucleoid DNA-binding protein